MCNLYEQEKAWLAYCEFMQAEALPAPLQADAPDLPIGSKRPSDPAAVILSAGGKPRLELLPWSWKRADGRPLLNVTAERWKGPPAARGIVPIDAFYEYRGEKAPKQQWRFTPTANEPQGFAVAVQDGRYVLITTEPGPDVEPVHDRQPAILGLRDWHAWLSEPDWPRQLLKPSPAGALQAMQTR